MSIAKTMILFGGGGHAAVVTESARAAGFVVLGFLSDSGHEEDETADVPEVMGLKRLGSISDFATIMTSYRHANGHAAVGDASLREQWLEIMSKKPMPTPAVSHPTAAVSPSARIGEGVFIGPQAVVNARAAIGRGAIINSAAIVEHDCTVGEFCHLAPRSALAGGVSIGRGTLLGVSCTVIPKVRIGAGCTLAAGAVVISDIPDGAMAMGLPARVAE